MLDASYARVPYGPHMGFAIRFRPLACYVARIEPPTISASMIEVHRACYGERALDETVTEGVEQYVMLCACMALFALRRPSSHVRIDVFEVDHRLEQRKKLERVRRAR